MTALSKRGERIGRRGGGDRGKIGMESSEVNTRAMSGG